MLSHIVRRNDQRISAVTSFLGSFVTSCHEMQRSCIILITRNIAMLPNAQHNVADIPIYHLSIARDVTIHDSIFLTCYALDQQSYLSILHHITFHLITSQHTILSYVANTPQKQRVFPRVDFGDYWYQKNFDTGSDTFFWYQIFSIPLTNS